MTVSSTNRKAGPYAGDGISTTFAFAFKTFAAEDLLVVRLDVATGAETVLTLTSDYSVVLNSNQNSNPGGEITLVALQDDGLGGMALLPTPLLDGEDLIITTDMPNLQTTNITNQGGFYPAVVTDALDRLTVLVQQVAEQQARTLIFPVTDPVTGVTLPPIAQRASRALLFDDDGVPIAGPSAATIGTLFGNLTNMATVAGIADEITTVAGISGNVTTVASVAADIPAVAGAVADITSVLAIADDLAAVADITLDVSAVATIVPSVPTLLTLADAFAAVAAIVDDVVAVAAIVDDVTAVADVTDDVTTVAGVATHVPTVAGISGNVTTVAGVAASIPTVAGVAANVTTVAGISGNVTTVAGISGNVTTVAGVAASVPTVAGVAADIPTVAGIAAGIPTVAGVAADIPTVAGVAANVTTVAGISGNVTTVAGVAADIPTVAGISGNVTTVAGIAAKIPTVADNVADITNFADVYLGPSATAPTTRTDTSPLQAGDLYFNTVANQMYAYSGSAWGPTLITAHNGLAGLNGDDHTQYYNQTRGDARYSQVGHNHDSAYSAVGHNHSGVYANSSHTHGEADLSLADNTTNNVSTTKHGFVPKAPNNTAHFLNGAGAWSAPDHGSIGGLADDDHTQYYNQTRGDARYSQVGHNHDSAYAASGHNHDSAYAASGHNHDASYYAKATVDNMVANRKRNVLLKLVDDNTSLAIKDNVIVFPAPQELNGFDLVAAHAMVSTVSSSGLPTYMVKNVTTTNNMLSTSITIDASEFTSYTAATAPVINSSYKQVSTGDRIAINKTVAGTGAKGDTIILTFEKTA